MQSPTAISLNAMRVFLVVSRHLSIKQAAQDLSVTPGAVSHQIRALEQALNVQLFERSNNAITLTDVGAHLAQKSAPGLQILHNAIEELTHGGNRLRVRASMSFAIRWLIPKLHLFKRKFPDIVVEVETFFNTDHPSSGSADLSISYVRYDERPADGIVLFEDRCRAYLAPALLEKMEGSKDVTSVPALQCSKGNWDWKLWLSDMGMPDAKLNYTERFDMDDAALRAASGGLGMVLASEALIEAEIQDGRLVPLQFGAQIHAGCYAIEVITENTASVRKFVCWLRETVKHRPEG